MFDVTFRPKEIFTLNCIFSGWLVFIRGILVYAQVKKSVRAGQAIYIPRYWGLTRTE
jgi:hypothetical protein